MSLLEVFMLMLGLIHIWISPYAKVEESFNLQACHDMLFHGAYNISQYDHLEFPGVVPRTFLGIIPVAFFALPWKFLVKKMYMQYIARSILWCFSFSAWRYFKQAIERKYGRDTSFCFTLITMVQFHCMFYMGRTLPNTFALVRNK